MDRKKVTVLIVDDSASSRELLAYIMSRSPDLHVIGSVENGEKAIEFLKYHRPDVITMDVVMPKMDGFQTTRHIMETDPLPIIMITSSYNPEDVDKSFKAIEAGSVAILEKPHGIQDPAFPKVAQNIIDTIRTMSDVQLITRRKKIVPDKKSPIILETPSKPIESIAIGASLGGPQALQTILSDLPANFPVPIYIVQHISHGFIDGLVDWLGYSTKLKVKVAQTGMQAKPGEVIIAPDQYHLGVGKNNRILLNTDPPDGGLKPSISYLFRSIADNLGAGGVGVLLTGMGRDGVVGMQYMREKGCITIAQDEEGCIMFGMPKEAIQAGAAKHIIPLHKIAASLTGFVLSKAVRQL